MAMINFEIMPAGRSEQRAPCGFAGWKQFLAAKQLAKQHANHRSEKKPPWKKEDSDDRADDAAECTPARRPKPLSLRVSR
jgi:hypothetical protein